jgi:hypothetical protein
MPYSVRTRKKIERTRNSLKKRVKQVQKLTEKRMEGAQIITLPDVSLGDLRRRYKRKQTLPPQAVLRQVPNFTRIPSNPDKPLLIYGSDDGLLACRVRLKHPDLIQDLSNSIDALPPKVKRYKFKGIERSKYEARHFGVWAPYSKESFITREHRDDGAKATQFFETNKRLFEHMSAVLGGLAPGVFKEMQRYPVGKDLPPRFCGAWTACVVNHGGKFEDPEETEIHRDVSESQYGYSCVVCCGDFSGGAIVLHDLRHVIEMEAGDILLFPDSLLHHCNEAATGIRKSVVAFTQENMYDYWRRKYKMLSKRRIRKELQNENLKVAKKLMAIMKKMDKEREKAKVKRNAKKHAAAVAKKRKQRAKVIAPTV